MAQNDDVKLKNCKSLAWKDHEKQIIKSEFLHSSEIKQMDKHLAKNRHTQKPKTLAHYAVC